jgi:diaminopimelate decarboxylase
VLYPLSYGGGSCTSRGRSYSHVAGAIPALVVPAKAAVSCTSMPTDHTVATAPLERHLLPRSALVDERGHLHVGGIDLLELVEQFGTPLFVYDEAHLRQACREAVAAWGDGVAYATKAFLCRAMARLADEEGMHLDVASGGELHVALAAGVAPERLILHGNNKSADELATAVREGVGRIVIDSFDEIARLGAILESSAPGGERPKVLVRVTPGVEAHTHEFVRTGQEDSKFGFSVSSGAAAQAVAALELMPTVELAGVHAHIGSQVFEASSFEQAAEVLGAFFAPLGLPELVVGGGLGVPYVNGESAPTLAAWAEATRSACTQAGVGPATRISAEPGRSIVATAGMTLYTVGTVKHLPGIRTYVSVDGGMSDNPRPVLYGSGYEAFLPRAVGAPRPRPVRVVGKHCESGDLVVPEAFVPDDLHVGDVLATPVTGAYGYVMASNYNKVPRPAVVFVADGAARVVVRRETFDDLVRLDA